MFNSGTNLSMPVQPLGSYGGGNNSGWGDGNGWWVLIILFALFGGGGRGYGNNGDGGGSQSSYYYTDSALQRGFDNQSVMNKLNGLENGLCSLGYDQLAQMNNLGQSILTTGFQLQNTAQQNAISNMQQFNSVERQLADCCCENRAAIAQVRYDMATDTCNIQNAIQNAARDIMENDNANYRSLYQQQIDAQMAAKDAEITRLSSALQACQYRSDNDQQTQIILNAINPPIGRSYIVPNPNAWNYNNWNGNCCNNNWNNNNCCN